MNRRIIITVAALLAVALGVTFVATREGDEPYRFAAVFDTAEGVAPGFVVKVAGVKVGRVHDVSLAPGLKARTVLEIDRDFAPLKADARCRILPESLISEKFVDCSPGRDHRPLRAGSSDGLPTVDLAHTTVPVAVQDVLDIFAQPANDRLRILLNEMGASVAGRSGDLNQILRRANPMLEQTRGTLRIVNGQRRQLRAAIAQTDDVVAALAARREDVRAFVARADDVAQATAPRAKEIGAAVKNLPGLARSATRSFRHLRQTADAVTPLLADVRAAAPRLTSFATLLPPFERDATPAVVAVSDAARVGRRAASGAAPVVRWLKRFAATSGRPVNLLEDFLTDLRDRGGVEGTLRFLYTLSSLTASYDSVSHLVTAQLTATPCLLTPEAEGCDGRFVSQARPAVASDRTARRTEPTQEPSRRRLPQPKLPSTSPTKPPAAAPTGPAGPVERLLDGLLRGIQPIVPGRTSPDAADPLDSALLDYLLGR